MVDQLQAMEFLETLAVFGRFIMATEKRDSTQAQSLSLHNRKSLEVNGVNDVIRFDEESVVLSTVCGTLTVEGTSLHVQVLDLASGTVVIDGKVDALLYFDTDGEETEGKRSWLGRLFR